MCGCNCSVCGVVVVDGAGSNGWGRGGQTLLEVAEGPLGELGDSSGRSFPSEPPGGQTHGEPEPGTGLCCAVVRAAWCLVLVLVRDAFCFGLFCFGSLLCGVGC